VGNGPDSYSLGLYILSRVHFDKCRRNDLGWGIVQAQQSGAVIP
jgi:hypothetical protein